LESTYPDLSEKETLNQDVLACTCTTCIEAFLGIVVSVAALVLGGKIALAKSMGVDIRHTVLLDGEINMDQMDLCSILGNTLDNALEECARMGGGNAGKFVFIELENSVDALRLTVGNSAGPAGGPPAGSKSSKQGQGHGIGLAIVRRAVEKYGGTMETGHDGAAYQVRINIPSKQPNGPHPPH